MTSNIDPWPPVESYRLSPNHDFSEVMLTDSLTFRTEALGPNFICVARYAQWLRFQLSEVEMALTQFELFRLELEKTLSRLNAKSKACRVCGRPIYTTNSKNCFDHRIRDFSAKARVNRWRIENREKYNLYMKSLMRRLRKRRLHCN